MTFVTVLLLSPLRFSTMSERGDRIPIIRLTIIQSLRLLAIVGVLATTALAQPQAKPKRVHAPTTIRGLVGGEANDTYVIHVRKGRTLTVEISWKKEDDNTASFSVTDSRDGGPISFGQESNGGRKWSGNVPKSADYFIEVVAHPAAHYVLKLMVK
jgi:hypothetical protein